MGRVYVILFSFLLLQITSSCDSSALRHENPSHGQISEEDQRRVLTSVDAQFNYSETNKHQTAVDSSDKNVHHNLLASLHRPCERPSRRQVVTRPDPIALRRKHKLASALCPCGVIEFSELQRRYFYSLKDISIGGMCICNGHARDCSMNSRSQLFSCACEHHTSGENCERCKPNYNQYKWQPGTSGFICKPCNCHGHSDECYYDKHVENRQESLNVDGEYSGGGVCIECKHFTEGINCERCQDGYYRPYNVPPNAAFPCMECQCDTHGTQTTSGSFVCVKDINDGSGVMPGTCQCKKGYSGIYCDRCASGYHDFPLCYPCACSIQGSLNNDPCAGSCNCKKNVVGKHCDQCKPGYFNLHSENSFGCESCFCSKATSECESSNYLWSTIQTNEKWELGDAKGRRVSKPRYDSKTGFPYFKHSKVSRELGTTTYYWIAPINYQGNRLSSYGGFLRYTVAHEIGLQSHHLAVHYADVILEGRNEQSLHYVKPINENLNEYEASTTFTVQLRPTSWSVTNSNHDGWFIGGSQNIATKNDFLMVLTDLRRLLIRAVYSRNIGATYSLKDVKLDEANENGNGEVALSVEICKCPSGYVGNSCEDCQEGFWRNGDACEPCKCNSHSEFCDRLNGACWNCRDNTMGMFCERCKPGYVGNATLGTLTDCKRCECPLKNIENNFSPTCEVELSTGNVICNRCPVGYEGQSCENCSDGFFGNPMHIGSQCLPCDCHGNSNKCDRRTGRCYSCRRHTAGEKCERCQHAYYGDAIFYKNCAPCDCDSTGSTSQQCDSETGQCPCIPNVYGRKCDICPKWFYLSRVAKMCVPCNCNSFGSKFANSERETCNKDGTCICKNGVEGKQCDRCSRGHYDFENGCRKCNCTETGGNCDKVTGQCACPPNTEGPLCNRCIPGTYSWSLQLGCKKCGCSKVGSLDVCDASTGACICKKEYTAKYCDQCRIGYYNYPECKRCECNKDGVLRASCSNEDEDTCSCDLNGDCICKENVIGKFCDICKPGTFGLSSENEEGCTECYCSRVSSICKQSTLTFGKPIQFDYSSQQNKKLSVKRLAVNQISWSPQNSELSQLLPYYWRLPSQFNGDKSLSYGGKFSFTVYFQSKLSDRIGERPRANVVIQGGKYSNLTMQYFSQDPINRRSKTYSITMQENGWTHLDGGQSVTRHEFISVLKDIHYFMVKAFYGHFMVRSRLNNVSLDIAEINGRGDNSIKSPPALGIEECECPIGYVGLSCQNCAEGFMRVINGKGIAICQPCVCSNRSNVCEINTGRCLHCERNFTGAHCELCKPGFYLHENKCVKCACPSTNPSNTFSLTCHKDYNKQAGYTCDECAAGYEGKYCEICSDGYFGAPTILGGSCKKCGCNVAGSIDGACNKTTGQCNCDAGITGRVCDQCDTHHIITNTGCKECTDDCVENLLMETNLLKTIIRVNVTSSLTPWQRLQNATRKLEEILFGRKINITEENLQRKKNSLRKKLKKIKKMFNRLQKEVKKCTTKSRKLILKSKSTSSIVNSLNKQVEGLLQSSLALSQKMRRLKREMVKGNIQTINEFNEKVYELVEKMNAIPMYYYTMVARVELSKAKSFLVETNTTIHKMKPLVNKLIEEKMEIINRTIAKIRQKFNEISDFLSKTKKQLKATNITNNLNRQTLRQSKSSIEKLVNEKKITENNLIETKKLIKEAKNITNLATQEIDNQKHLAIAMKNNSEKLREKIDIKMGGNDLRELRNAVENAEIQGGKLEDLSDYIIKVFNNVSQYYRNQTKVVDDPLEISLATKKANETATEALEIARNESKIFSRILAENQIEKSFIISRDIISKAKNLNETIKGNRNQLKDLNEALYSANDTLVKFDIKSSQYLNQIINLKKTSNAFDKDLKSLKMINNKTSLVLENVTQKLKEMEKTTRRLKAIRKKIRNKPKILEDIGNKLDSGPSKVRSSTQSLDEISIKKNSIKETRKRLNDNIEHLRRLIKASRNKAAEIEKPSIKSTGSCAMTYKVSTDISKTTKIELNFQTTQKNNLLFYLEHPQKDFLAIEMRDGRVEVKWNLGGGTAHLVHPLNLSMLTTNFETDNWFKVKVERVDRTLNLTVHKLNHRDQTTVSNQSPGPYSILDVNENDLIIVGSAPSSIQIRREVQSRTFNGCMGKALLQDKSIGLWSFNSISNSSDCIKCNGLPQQLTNQVFGYFGSGYSVISLCKINEESVRKVIFLIEAKTIISNGIIMYIGNKSNDFISIELIDGKVVVKLDLGNGVRNITSDSRQNTGEWFKIHFIMMRSRAQLSSPKSSRNSLDLSDTDGSFNLQEKKFMYIGGFPKTSIANIRNEVMKEGFVGCLRNPYLNSRIFRLKASNIKCPEVIDAGVSDSCPHSPRNIRFEEGGFIEVDPVDLSPFQTFVLSFQTRSPNAVLLAGLDRKSDSKKKRKRSSITKREPYTREDFYSIFLDDGCIVARLHLDGGSVMNLISRHSFYNNGEIWVVTLSRKGTNVTLRINDNDDTTTGSYLDPNTSLKTKRLFIGGIPDDIEIGSIVPDNFTSLKGCLLNIFADNLNNFLTPKQQRNAYIGRCSNDDSTSYNSIKEGSLQSTNVKPYIVGIPTTPALSSDTAEEQISETETETLQCGTPKYSSKTRRSSAHFGKHRNTFLMYGYERPISKRFTISLRIRTYARTGLLLYTGNNVGNDFFALKVKDGVPIFQFNNGKGNAETVSKRTINDGKWHSIKVKRFKRKGVLYIDKKKYKTNSPKGDTKMDVDRTLYVGGVSPYLEHKVGSISRSMDACITNLVIGKHKKTLRSALQNRGVEKCYQNVEKGAFFEGNSFVKYKSAYRVGTDMEIYLQFKTSSPNGVLLNVEEPRNDLISLELVQGDVVFRADNGGGMFEVVYSSSNSCNECKQNLCDGKWHSITARKSQRKLLLQVDDNEKVEVISTHHQTAADTWNPLFIGGIQRELVPEYINFPRSFRGCIRQMSIKGDLVDFEEAEETYQVVPNSCPNQP